MTTEDERNNSIYFTCQGLGIQSVYSNAKLNDGYWHNVVGTWDGTTQSLYIDGILDNSQLNWGQINTNDLPATIGARAISATEAERSWNGLIDDVRIYSYAIPLTKAEGGDDSVEGLYEMGLPLCYGDILDGDFNENCYIDLLDFGVLSASWMDSYGMDDLAALAGNWLSCNHPLDPECELPF